MITWKQYPEDVPKKNGYYLKFNNPLHGSGLVYYSRHDGWAHFRDRRMSCKVIFWAELPPGPEYFNDCPQSLDQWPIDNTHTVSLLRSGGINTLNELINCSSDYIRSIPGIGPSKIKYIEGQLKEAGLSLYEG